MANRRNSRNQTQSGGSNANRSDTEFGQELTQSKKARKRAAREKRKKQQ